MPSAPPARVSSISEFSTVAGCSFAASCAVAVRLETHRVDGAVDLRLTEDLLDLVLRVALRHVDGLAAEAAGLREPFLVEVADDHDGGAEQLRRGGRGEADRAGAGDVDGRAGGRPRPCSSRGSRSGRCPTAWPGRGSSPSPGRGRGTSGSSSRRTGPGRSSPDRRPSAHVDVAVRRAGPVGVHVQADAGLALLAVATAAAGDVERHADHVADLEELDVPAPSPRSPR